MDDAQSKRAFSPFPLWGEFKTGKDNKPVFVRHQRTEIVAKFLWQHGLD